METFLERAKTAQQVGIDPAAVQALAEDLIANGMDLHSLLVIRHGKVSCEVYRAPFHRESVHMVFSISKSFLSAAYGFALQEGLLTKETKFLDVFPELRPEKPDPYLEKLTIYHLMSMTSGKRTHRGGKNWLRTFVKAKWDFEPGTSFRYVNENYSAAAAAIRRLAGMSVTEYLTPRLYEPLGMDVPVWETRSDDTEAGGWGLLLKTEDIAKFILCCHNGGVLFDKQILPADYIREATSCLTDSSVSQSDADSAAGYGLGFWQCAGHPHTFRCEGMYSQYAVSFADEDACIVMTGSNPNLQSTLDTLWAHTGQLFIEPQEGAEPVTLVLPPSITAKQSPRSPLEAKISGKLYALNKPRFVDACGYPISVFPMQVTFFSRDKGGDMTNLCFRFRDNDVVMTWDEKRNPGNRMVLPLNGQTAVSRVRIGELDFDCSGFAFWTDDRTLEVWIKPIPATITRRFIFTFRGNTLTMQPRTVPDMEERTKATGEKLKSILKGKYFEWWIKVLVPRVGKILQPTEYGVVKGHNKD